MKQIQISIDCYGEMTMAGSACLVEELVIQGSLSVRHLGIGLQQVLTEQIIKKQSLL